MSTWVHDVYYCLRRLARAPGFALTTVALLALAIAANAGVFSLVYCLLYKPLPVADSDRLVNIRLHLIRENADSLVPAEAIQYVTAQRQIFDQAAGAIRDNSELQNGPDVEATDLSTLLVDPHLFALLGLRPTAGRLLNDADLHTHNPGSLLVGAAFAVHRFGSVAAAMDQELELNRGRYRIVGVMPANVPYGRLAKLWIPVSFSADGIHAHPEFTQRSAVCIGRLARGVTAADAGRGMTAFLAALPQYQDNSQIDDVQIRAEPLRTLWLGDTESFVLTLMLGTALLLMLISGINACNLYIARLASRQHESALFAALGAGPGRLARLLLTEAAIISVVATGIALALAPAGLRVLAYFDLIPEETPYPIGVDRATVAFVALLAVAVAAALGSSAWWLQPSGGAAHEVLKQAGSRQTAGVRVRDARNALTVAQVALTVALLFGSGLLLHSAHKLLTEDLGFNRERLLLTGLNLQAEDPTTYGTAARRLLDRALATPGVVAATLASTMSFGDSAWERNYQPPGAEIPDIGRWPTATFYDDTEPAFFSVLGQPIVAGRPFTADEARAEAPVAIVDTTFVKRHFPDGAALGRSFRINLPASDSTNMEDHGMVREVTIVGVVGPVKSWSSFMGVDEKPAIYVPGLNGAQLIIRTAIDPGSLQPALKRIVHEISPKARLGVTSVLTDRIATFASFRFRLNGLLALLGVVTLVLAGVGLYAVLSYSVRMRMREFGVRLALGANASQLRGDVLLQGLRLAAIGAIVGLPLAFGLSNVLVSQLYHVGRLDPVTLVAVMGVIAVVSAVASWWPARAAARVDPMTALRAE
jgi:putative ABC transport system permease protein